MGLDNKMGLSFGILYHMSSKVNLNQNQHKAVYTNDRYVRIVAGAGSGKTRVLIERISHLISDLGVFPPSILAITFTNKAANEMKERLDQMMGSSAAGVHISTIHSLCVRILREDSPSMDLPRNFTVMDQDDQKSILKEAYKEIGLEVQKISLNSMLDYIGGNKGAEVSPERAAVLAGNHPGEKDKAAVYKYYVDRQKALYALDFDDLLLVTVKMFETHASICEKWQRRFNFVHVDEFQDIDRVQYKLIKQLTGSKNQLYVVGDPDQTIYTWRGADVNIIMNFEKDFKPTSTIVLNQNYRSTKHILAGANTLIKNNQFRLDKDLFTEKESDDKITHCSFANEEEEARWILKEIQKKHDSGLAYKNMAILYRSNYLSRSIEKGCLDAQVPYVIYGGTRFYDRAEIKDMLAYLRMLTTADDLAFKRIINVPKRGIGNKTVDTIHQEAKKQKCSYYQLISNNIPITGKSAQTLERFVEMIERFKKMMVDEKPILDILEAVANESGIRHMYEENHETDRIENIKELINDVITFQNQYPEAGLDEYLQMVSLYGDKNELNTGEYIQMMTIHAAKGLEFDTVFVIGLSEGVFPNDRAVSEGKRGLEEERRLAYVAYTRAKNKLYLSEVSGFSFVLNKVRSRSRFVDEVDQKHLDHIGVNYNYNQAQSIDLKTKFGTKAAFSDGMRKVQKSKYKVGDLVSHTSFGQGVILSLDGVLAEIAFDYPNGVKKLMVEHPSITKV